MVATFETVSRNSHIGVALYIGILRHLERRSTVASENQVLRLHHTYSLA